MLGLAVLFFIALYLLVSLVVVWLSARAGRKRGRRGWVWGGVAALIMYNLVFWDLIPTVLMHRYYCATDAGFWVYKTPEQWLEEERGTGSATQSNPQEPSRASKAPVPPDTVRIQLTPRFYKDVRRGEEVAMSLGKSEEMLYDAKTGEPIAKSVQFILGNDMASTASGGSIEGLRRALVFGWLRSRQCSVPGEESLDGVSPTYRKYSQFVLEFLRQGED